MRFLRAFGLALVLSLAFTTIFTTTEKFCSLDEHRDFNIGHEAMKYMHKVKVVAMEIDDIPKAKAALIVAKDVVAQVVKENMIKMQSKEIMKVTRIAAAKAANNIASKAAAMGMRGHVFGVHLMDYMIEHTIHATDLRGRIIARAVGAIAEEVDEFFAELIVFISQAAVGVVIVLGIAQVVYRGT